MRLFVNPHRGRGIAGLSASLGNLRVVDDATMARKLFARCPVADTTPLVSLPELAEQIGVGSLDAKDERQRLNLGSFKALGAAFAIAKLAVARAAGDDLSNVLAGETFITASAGNHGISVAAGARTFGAKAVVYLSENVPEVFAQRLREKGADVVRSGHDYETSFTAAKAARDANDWRLLSDTSWPGYVEPTRDIMEGYTVMAAEVGEQISASPTHIFLQAGVGGLAAACAAVARRLWGDEPRIVIVEPELAPAVMAAVEAGKIVNVPGPVSEMGRLDCKEASLLALEVLARDADALVTISEADAAEAVDLLGQHGMRSTTSGAAGFTGLLAAWRVRDSREELGLDDQSRVLIYVSEGPEDD